MTQTATFGVVGGYGSTGRVVVSELHKCCRGEILIGGRDLAKANALAGQFGSRMSAARIDVLDSRALDDFCSQCSIVVNCGGPVMALQDRVAQAAFRKHCHYVDAAGLLVVKERMLPHGREIADLGLSFVISAGLLPGISEILPIYAYAQAKAKAKMDVIESLSIYYGDTGEWSRNAFREIAWLMRERHRGGPGHMAPGYFRKGAWVKLSMLTSHTADLGGRIGQRRFFPGFIPEMSELSFRFADCDLFSYGCVPGLRMMTAATLVSMLPLPGDLGARLLRDAFRKNRLPVGGFVVVKVVGLSDARKLAFTVQMVYEEDRGYWLNGLVAATVARLISNREGVQAGVHFLPDAVDSMSFTAELQKSGVELTETLEPHA
ncbi:MAG TPA: saccharopine dehydrogenase NADP-binding domain-containing protein [Terriglobales bacterium]|nr:saccharopine dehydrogenase NADP-binding domain-containing protein [Terriglobales bacterium]